MGKFLKIFVSILQSSVCLVVLEIGMAHSMDVRRYFQFADVVVVFFFLYFFLVVVAVVVAGLFCSSACYAGEQAARFRIVCLCRPYLSAGSVLLRQRRVYMRRQSLVPPLRVGSGKRKTPASTSGSTLNGHRFRVENCLCVCVCLCVWAFPWPSGAKKKQILLSCRESATTATS